MDSITKLIKNLKDERKAILLQPIKGEIAKSGLAWRDRIIESLEKIKSDKLELHKYKFL